MYKLKIKQGEKIIIKDNRRSGINCTLEYGVEYPQSLLARLHENGFKLVTKQKPKKEL